MQEYIFPPSNPLSNFWAVSEGFMWKGMLWSTSEHAYQAGKYMYEGSPEANKQYIEIIRTQPSPSKAKCFGSQKTMKYLTYLQPFIDEWKPYVRQNPNWEENKIDVMRSVLRAKWEGSNFFREILESTGFLVIKEASQYDYYWGIGQNGTGNNVLGLLLMELRDATRLN